MSNLTNVNEHLSGGDTVILNGADIAVENHADAAKADADSRLWPGASADTASTGTFAWLRKNMHSMDVFPSLDED